MSFFTFHMIVTLFFFLTLYIKFLAQLFLFLSSLSTKHATEAFSVVLVNNHSIVINFSVAYILPLFSLPKYIKLLTPGL